jgi:hypothetical protein
MGGEFAAKQVQRLVDMLRPTGEIAVAMDSDHAGRLAQMKMVDALRKRVSKVSVVTWPGKDPTDNENGQFSAEQVEDRALKALAVRMNWLDARISRLLTNA